MEKERSKNLYNMRPLMMQHILCIACESCSLTHSQSHSESLQLSVLQSDGKCNSGPVTGTDVYLPGNSICIQIIGHLSLLSFKMTL